MTCEILMVFMPEVSLREVKGVMGRLGAILSVVVYVFDPCTLSLTVSCVPDVVSEDLRDHLATAFSDLLISVDVTQEVPA